MPTVLGTQLDAAQQALPPAVWDYSGDEVTSDEAEAAWRSYRLRPRVLNDVSSVDVSTRLLGTDVDSPFVVVPMAFHGLAHADGECATVSGASRAGA